MNRMMEQVDVPNYLNPRKYISCIKIYGIPIFPPLVTDESKQELNEYKLKAIAIEDRLKKKRSSIDSGVMTGSYIETLKSGDMPQAGNICDQNRTIGLSLDETASCDCPPYDSSESFLMTALQDPQFREYFCSTADRIFKDNGISGSGQGDRVESPILCITGNSSEDCSKDLLLTHDRELSDYLPDTYVCFSSIDESGVGNNDGCGDRDHSSVQEGSAKVTELLSESTCSRVRRNSYTLDGPSPVLLELMERENSEVNSEKNKSYKSFLPYNDTVAKKGSVVKNVSCNKKPRKTWNKTGFEPSCVEPAKTGHGSLIRRSKTFVKPVLERRNSPNSLPASSRTSPTPTRWRFARSVDCCLDFVGRSLLESNQDMSQQIQKTKTHPFENSEVAFQNSLVPNNNMQFFENNHIPEKDLGSSLVQNMANLSLLNNTSGSKHNIYDLSCDSSRIGFNDAASQVSNCSLSINNSLISQADTIKNAIRNKDDVYIDADDSVSVTYKNANKVKKDDTAVDRNCVSFGYKKVSERENDRLVDVDDTLSISSSLSLSKFLPFDNGLSGPPAADENSTILLELQRTHEKQLKDLLEKQRQEKLFFSHIQIKSVMSARSGTSLSGCSLQFEQDFPADQFTGQVAPKNSINSLSRELFPVNNDAGGVIRERNQMDMLEAQERAATTITAFAKGYLMRRLLRTEKVKRQIQQLKETLAFGLKMQEENELAERDLNLLEQLEKQMTVVFDDLHETLSAPAAHRMRLIALDRERLQKPVPRPSSAFSTATILRRQRSSVGSASSLTKKMEQRRARTKSLSNTPSSHHTAFVRSSSFVKSDCSSGSVETKQRKPWR